ncbi:MAG: GxxExxY protein [Elusimicrobia bacterium]|nr:GxxExxY protein [Elusimicrobiota bacterium]
MGNITRIDANMVLYKDLSYKLVGCFYKVYNTLGPAHKEQIYQKALSADFKLHKILFVENKKLPIQYNKVVVGTYQPDFIIEDKIIIEIKSVLLLPKVFEKQLYYYLRGTKYKLGYLVNFGAEKIQIKRRIYETVRTDSL